MPKFLMQINLKSFCLLILLFSSSLVFAQDLGGTFWEKQVQEETESNLAENSINPDSTFTLKENVEEPATLKSNNKFEAISINQNKKEKTTNTKAQKAEQANNELSNITKKNDKEKQGAIDTINFIQPSLDLTEDEQDKVDIFLSRAEQEQLLVLWRSTLERNKTIRFIVQKLAPETEDKKRNQVLSQILNTAVFLPFYAIQSVAPGDYTSFAGYMSSGVASDLINGKMRNNTDKLILTQTEMVIMFMMIDQIAERVRTQYHDYKRERVDYMLAAREMEEAKEEAAAALGIDSGEALFLTQIRIRQLEREMKRINARLRSNRIVIIDLCGSEALGSVDKLIDKEMNALLNLPPL